MPTQYLFLFLLSMVPVIELRGAVPIGIGWGLPFWAVYAVSVLGNIFPIPFLIPFARHVLQWCATLPKIGRLFQKIIDIGNRKIQKVESAGRAISIGLFLFVAIPAPGTGAWTGCLIATLLQMRLKKAFLPIALGVLASGIIMGIACYGVFGLFTGV